MTSLFDREETLTFIRRVEEVPTLPDRFFKIREVIEDGKSDSRSLGLIIGTDSGTASMVLKMANSSYFNPAGSPVSTLSHAIARLGFKEAARIAMAMSLFHGFALQTGMHNVRMFWTHAYAVAVLGRQMAETLELDAEEMFMAGLLHDIGRVILGLRVDMSYFDNKIGRLRGDPLIENELETFGIDHAEVGSELLSLWRFPASIRDAVGKHHEAGTSFLPARVISVADKEVHKHLPNNTDIEQVQALLKGQFPEGVSALLEAEGFS